MATQNRVVMDFDFDMELLPYSQLNTYKWRDGYESKVTETFISGGCEDCHNTVLHFIFTSTLFLCVRICAFRENLVLTIFSHFKRRNPSTQISRKLSARECLSTVKS